MVTGAPARDHAGRRRRSPSGSRSRSPRAASWRSARPPPGMRTYLLVSGGLDVPQVLGLVGDLRPRQDRRDHRRPAAAGRPAARSAPPPASRRARRPRPTARTSPAPGRSARSRARTRRRSSSRRATSPSSTPPPGRSTSTRPARASGSSAPSPPGRGPTAARRACTRRTSTTPRTRSARSTTPATCRSCSARTARRSAGSPARRRSRSASCGSWASCAPATPCGSCRSTRPRRTRCARARRRSPAGDAERPRRRRHPGPRSDADDATVTYRRSGDDNLLVEYGAMTLDLASRMRVHALAQQVQDRVDHDGLRGIVDLTPGHPLAAAARRPGPRCRCARRSTWSARSRTRCPPTTDLVVPSRTVHLPLSWDDPATREAIERYMAGVRDDAPWCPWNIEFIRRINGLALGRRRLPDRVRRVVPGHGPGRRVPGRPGRHPAGPAAPAGHHEVQPGPHLDPAERGRHRRRLPVHLRHGGPGRLPVRRPHHPGLGHPRAAQAVRAGHPLAAAVLRHDPLVPGRRGRAAGHARRHGRRAPRRRHRRRARSRSPSTSSSWPTTPPSIDAFRAQQAGAFGAERDAWAAAGEFDRVAEPDAPAPAADTEVPDGCEGVEAPFVATVFRVDVRPGDVVERGQQLLALEAMKMEAPVTATVGGTVRRHRRDPGRPGRPRPGAGHRRTGGGDDRGVSQARAQERCRGGRPASRRASNPPGISRRRGRRRPGRAAVTAARPSSSPPRRTAGATPSAAARASAEPASRRRCPGRRPHHPRRRAARAGGRSGAPRRRGRRRRARPGGVRSRLVAPRVTAIAAGDSGVASADAGRDGRPTLRDAPARAAVVGVPAVRTCDVRRRSPPRSSVSARRVASARRAATLRSPSRAGSARTDRCTAVRDAASIGDEVGGVLDPAGDRQWAAPSQLAATAQPRWWTRCRWCGTPAPVADPDEPRVSLAQVRDTDASVRPHGRSLAEHPARRRSMSAAPGVRGRDPSTTQVSRHPERGRRAPVRPWCRRPARRPGAATGCSSTGARPVARSFRCTSAGPVGARGAEVPRRDAPS